MFQLLPLAAISNQPMSQQAHKRYKTVMCVAVVHSEDWYENLQSSAELVGTL